MKTSKKVLAVLLTIATLIGIFSCATTVFAEEYNEYADKKAYQEKLLTEAIETEKENAEIICEVPEKRDEFSKTYKRSDGSFTTVFSKTPLHKLNNGEWEEINNTLKQSGETITNTDGAFDVEFPETINENKKITISAGEESISFSVNDVENASADIEAPQTTEEDIIKSDLDKTVSQITYENVDDNTDIQYIVSSGSVKENIIVSNKESLKETYSFEIHKGELSATLDNENNLIFKNDKNETVFTIPAPVMTDADNAVSYDIQVKVENADKAVLTLTYTPSKEWLESAKYPVVIDPVIELQSSNEVLVEDTMLYYTHDDPESKNTNYSDYPLGVVANQGSVENNDHLKGEVLVKLNMDVFEAFKASGLSVTGVNYIVTGNATGGNLLAKPINDPWNSKIITYADVYPENSMEPAITYGTEIIDYYSGIVTEETSSDGQIINFNITDYFNQWLNGEIENNGFAIVPEDEKAFGMFLMGGVIVSNNGSKTYFDSYIAIDYVDSNCANDNFEYLTQEIGRAGTASVNIFSRSLSLSRNDLSMSGLRMPVDTSHIYNGAIDTFFEMYIGMMERAEGVEDMLPFPYGNNWKPSLFMGIFSTAEKQHLFFTEEGTIVTFNEKIETITEGEGETQITTTEIIFEEDETSDSGYTLELINQEDGVSTDNMKIISPNGEEMYFDNGGLVTEIREEEPNADGSYDKISIFYDEETGMYIDYITDGIGRIYDFVYSSETGLLSEIKCLTADGTAIKAGTTNTDLKVTYSYDLNGNLTSVTYPDGETVTYTYDSNGNLIKVQNIDNYNIDYIYDESGNESEIQVIDNYNIMYSYDALGKIVTITEAVSRKAAEENDTYEDKTINGNSIHLTQLSNRQVKVADDFSGTQTYQFGKDGKLHYTFDDKGNYLKSDYAPANDENVFSSNDWKIVSQNLLINGGFEETENGKTKEWTNSFNVEDIESSEAITDYACKILSSEEITVLQSQTVDVDGGNAYTFSFLAKANEATETGKLYASINIEDEDGNGENVYRQFSVTEDFKQYSVTIRSDRISEISKVTVEFGLKKQTGHFYVNNAQLEKGLGTAEYNLIENGSFTNNGEYWSESIIETDSINGEVTNTVKLSGSLPQYTKNDETLDITDHISAVTQNVEINGKKGETYSIGGWFKGYFDDNYLNPYIKDAYANHASQLTNSAAQLKVTYSYTDTVTETAGDGTTTTTEQTVTENFVVDFEPYNKGWQYAVDTFALKGDTESVDVTVMAKNVPADSFATGIILEQDFDSEVIYDEAEDSDSDIEELCLCGCEECYYGENCPCTGAINNDCQCPECLRKETSTKDDFGNTLSNKSTDGINYIETLSFYTEDGNNLKRYTDENGNVVSYDYNVWNGVLNSLESPFRTANEKIVTSYTYDEMGKILSISTALSETEKQTLQYVYSGDRVSEIITPNGKYRIIYNAWGQVASVNVVTGSGESENVIPLVEYTYNEGVNRTQVASLKYKNSEDDIAEYKYEYYDDGTVKKIFLNEEEIHFIEYNNLGVLTSIKNIGGRTVEYTDDGTFIYNPDGDCIYSTITNDDGSVTEENYGVTYKTFAPESDYDSATGVSTEIEKIEINANNRIAQETQSDYFGRTNSQNLSVYNITDESGENPAMLVGRINTEYGYSVEENGKTSSSVEKFINKTYNGNSESYRLHDGYHYEYDNQNKISAEKTLNPDGTTTDKYSYEYDKLGQLVRYNDAVENKTYTYTYDNNGNILTKSEYAYTTGDLGTATNIINFGYDTQWKDKLTTVGDKTIAYDNIGNPTNYLGATLTWEGRQLKSYENDEKLVTYEYDENGMRYRTTVVDKTAEDETIINVDYVWLGEKLVSMVLSDNETYLSAKYLYNSSDEIIGFKWVNDTADQSIYYYLKNLQGDITGVVSSAGKMQVSYSYDVFGKRSTQYHYNTSSLTWFEEMYNQIHISALNPFGYRGYCYDGYTELYYLQSRYYDPNTGRFINADDTNYLNATGTVLGCNLFAYCENDPVNRVDPRGTISLKLATALAAMGISLSAYNSFLCVRLYCWGFTHRKKNQTYDFSKKWKSLIKRRLESSKTMKNFVSKKINSMIKNGYSKKSYNFYPEFYKNLDKTISDLDLTLAIGGGAKFKITIKKTDKVDWVGRNYYEITADFKGEDFNFEAWKIEVLGKVFGDVEPHTSNPAVIMINDTGYITQAYGAFVEFFWKFKVTYKFAK